MSLHLYLHIPFCRSRCIYCDFFSTTREERMEEYVDALCREIEARRCEHVVTTIYFGGGTPSLLNPQQLRRILATIGQHYAIAPDAEVTLEANPDDVRTGFMGIEEGMINRVSLGIQTFDDELLRLLRRRHDGREAREAVRWLQCAGVRNVSMDLIYGLPGQTIEQWQRDVETALSIGVQHLSAYALSYEEGTLLSLMRDEGRLCEADEEQSVAMYELLCRRTKDAGFEHYEISNFALPGMLSRHNSSYWTGEPYLGFGPGAHSFDGLATRRANSPDLDAYLQAWQSSGQAPYPTPTTDLTPHALEQLTNAELFDEAVMCGLRTAVGIDLNGLNSRFGQQHTDNLLRAAAPHIAADRLRLTPDSHLRLTPAALMISDAVMADLMDESDAP